MSNNKIVNKIVNLFSKKQVQYTFSSGYGKPKWSSNKDVAYIAEGYNKIVWVYACVSLIANCVSSVEWCLYRQRGKNKTEIDNHPILDLLNKKVNMYTTSKDFFDIWSTYLATQGKFFCIYNSPTTPTSLEFLYPHNVKSIPSLVDFVSGYEYQIGGDKIIYNKDLVLWSKFFDPLDFYNGLSPIKAMARTIDTENEALDWNKNTLQNQAVPPGAIQVVNPSPELQQKLRKEWIERYSGSNNVRVPLILNAEKASYTSFGISPVDMDFINQRKLDRVEICTGFNVPSQLVGDPEGQTYANYAEAQKAFWQNTIIPKYLDNIKNCLNYDLCNRYADNLVIEPWLDKIEALQENRKVKIENVRGLWNDGIITRAEARQELDYETSEVDMLYKPINKTPSKIDDTEEEINDNEDEDEKVKKNNTIYY
jgi:HK97 family phage portal protein